MNRNEEATRETFNVYRQFPKLGMEPGSKETVKQVLINSQHSAPSKRRMFLTLKGVLVGLTGLAVVISACFAILTKSQNTMSRAPYKKGTSSANSPYSHAHNPIILTGPPSPKMIEQHVYSDYSGPRVVGEKAVLAKSPFSPVIPAPLPSGYTFNGIVLDSIPVIPDPSQFGTHHPITEIKVGQVTIGYITKSGHGIAVEERHGIAVEEQRNFGIFYVPTKSKKLSINGHPVWLDTKTGKVKQLIFYKGTLNFTLISNTSVQDIEKMAQVILDQR